MLKFLAAEEFTFWRDVFVATAKQSWGDPATCAQFADDSLEEIRKRLPEPTPIEPDPEDETT